MKTGRIVAAAVLVGGGLVAFAGQPEDQQVKFRQSAYAFIGWNCGKIKNLIVDHPENFDKEKVAAAATAIAAAANSGLGALYGPGTDTATGWKKSRLKPEFFEKQEDAKKEAQAFIKESNELAKVAAGGDQAAIKAQFGKLTDTCKSCHDRFRVKD